MTTTNLTSDEREPTITTGGESLSIFEIMQRYRNDGSCEHVIEDALRRLSLIDSQAVHYQLFAPCAEGEHADCIKYSNSLRRDAQLVRCSCGCHDYDAAIRMRDKCVAGVRGYLTDCRDEERGIIEAIALGLESLTLDQTEGSND